MRRPKKPKNINKLKERLITNKPVPSYKKDKKFMVLGKEGKKTKLIHFGSADYGHNITEQARKNFRSRMGCDKKTHSKLTAKHWACEFLWSKGSPKKITAKKGTAAKPKKRRK